MSKEFEISKLLQITKGNKYEACVAAFEVIGNLERLDIPRKYHTRKHAVQAMVALSEGIIKYDYIDDETRAKLEEELHGESKARAQSALDAVFSTPMGAAPMVSDSEEDLDEIGETAPSEALEDADEFADEVDTAAQDSVADEDEPDEDDADADADADPEEEPEEE